MESTFAGTATFTGHLTSSASPVTVYLWSAVNPTVSRQELHPSGSGYITASLPSLASGPQTVCIGVHAPSNPPPIDSSDPQCHRVFIAAQTLEDPAITTARVAEAMAIAKARFNWETELPGWRVEIGGASGSSGGLYRVDLKQIVIHATPGRTVAELTTTVFHELGHAVDVERLSLPERVEYQTMRGFDPASVWRSDTSDPNARWAIPAEDFAETFVVWATGSHVNRSVRPQQSAADLAFFVAIADLG